MAIAIKIEDNQDAVRCDICGAIVVFYEQEVEVHVVHKELHYHYVECPICENNIRMSEAL